MKTHELVIPAVCEPDAIQILEREAPAPGPGEALIAVEATGVSFAEVQMLRGRYPAQPAFPFVPGYDFVGRVLAVGRGGNAELVGQRVASITGFGAWAEHLVRRTEELAVIADELDAAEVDALIVNGSTAYKMLHRVAQVRPGQTVVVLGAGGGVGTMLVQLARIAGARVIGTCKPAQNAQVEALGASTVDYTRGDVLQAVRALAPGGVDAVFDHVGGDSLGSSYAMLRPGGFLINYGNAAALNRKRAPIWDFLGFFALKARWAMKPGRRRMTFFDVWGRGTFGADRLFRPRRFWREFREDLSKLVELLRAKKLTPQIARRMPLLEAPAALEAHRQGGLVGKIVLESHGSRAGAP